MDDFGKLKILDIRGINENKFGETVMVKANPITESSWGSISFTPYECEDTLVCIVPVSIVNRLVSIAQSNDFWEPSKFDFIKQTVLQNGTTSQEVYRHTGCYGIQPFLKYYVNQITLNNQDFQDFEEEHWTFERNGLLTPHGNLSFDELIFVDNGPMVGIQFSTHGTLRINEFDIPNNTSSSKSISTLAIMRQPHNVWLWAYLFDANNLPVASFCGHDDLDAFASYVMKMKKEFNQ